jgi:hypothetical protein
LPVFSELAFILKHVIDVMSDKSVLAMIPQETNELTTDSAGTDDYAAAIQLKTISMDGIDS